MIAIKKKMVKNCFAVMKKRKDDRVKIVKCRRRYFNDLLHNVFYSLRNQVYKRKVSNFVMQQYLKKFCQRTLSAWFIVAQKEQAADAAKLKSVEDKKCKLVIDAWAWFAKAEKEKKEKVVTGLEMTQSGMKRRVVGRWQ